MSRTLGTIDKVTITERADGSVDWTAAARIDCDGSDNRHGDPCWQADTSLHYQGKAIDAESVPYVVVPPLIRDGVKGIVLGCNAVIENIETGDIVDAVCADIGPRRKIGELSCEAARRLGLSGNPNHGGTEEKIIRYRIFPGIPAVVDGITYTLQPR